QSTQPRRDSQLGAGPGTALVGDVAPTRDPRDVRIEPGVGDVLVADVLHETRHGVEPKATGRIGIGDAHPPPRLVHPAARWARHHQDSATAFFTDARTF